MVGYGLGVEIILWRKNIAMEKNTKEEQSSGKPNYTSMIPADKYDHRLPHEVAAIILMAAYDVVVKKLAWERETGKLYLK